MIEFKSANANSNIKQAVMAGLEDMIARDKVSVRIDTVDKIAIIHVPDFCEDIKLV